MLIHATERPTSGFTDPRALFGSPSGDTRTEADRWRALRREAWEWLDRQWELWPRPDLMRAILVPPFLRRSRRAPC